MRTYRWNWSLSSISAIMKLVEAHMTGQTRPISLSGILSYGPVRTGWYAIQRKLKHTLSWRMHTPSVLLVRCSRSAIRSVTVNSHKISLRYWNQLHLQIEVQVETDILREICTLPRLVKSLSPPALNLTADTRMASPISLVIVNDLLTPNTGPVQRIQRITILKEHPITSL